MGKTYDVIVVGAGPAAWSAAIFAVRAGMSVLVVGVDSESGLADASDVRNFPGFPEGISGRTLLDNMIVQAKNQGVLYKKQEVTHTEEADGIFMVKTSDLSELRASNLILAHGANYIKANLPGEKEHNGKGVHYCALCDGPIYKGKKVVVLGNANLAAEEAMELSAYVSEVQIVSQSPQVNFSEGYKGLLESKGMQVTLSRVKEIKGDGDIAKSVLLEDGSEISFDALFIALGVASSLDFARQLGLEVAGDFIKVDESMRTSNPKVRAIGMARGGLNQIVKSVGDGGIAAVDLIKSVKGLPSYIDHT
jgi:thioredoxin reductase (NADPH)